MDTDIAKALHAQLPLTEESWEPYKDRVARPQSPPHFWRLPAREPEHRIGLFFEFFLDTRHGDWPLLDVEEITAGAQVTTAVKVEYCSRVDRELLMLAMAHFYEEGKRPPYIDLDSFLPDYRFSVIVRMSLEEMLSILEEMYPG